MKPKQKNKKILTIFIAMAPSVLLGMTYLISNAIGRLGFQTILLLLQFVIVRNMVDDYYGEDYNGSR